MKPEEAHDHVDVQPDAHDHLLHLLFVGHLIVHFVTALVQPVVAHVLDQTVVDHLLDQLLGCHLLDPLVFGPRPLTQVTLARHALALQVRDPEVAKVQVVGHAEQLHLAAHVHAA